MRLGSKCRLAGREILRHLEFCLACAGTDLFSYLDLGEMPLANSFHDGSKESPRFPLAVQACRSCWHSQLTISVDPHLMFDDYLYVSGTSETLRKYFAEFAARFPPGIRVLDIASNDGTLLRAFEARGCQAVGVEPGERFFDSRLAVHQGYWDSGAKVSVTARGKFDVITAFNVLGHTADPFAFLTLAREALAPGGTIWVQTSQASMVLDGTFDAIYHEHVSYFTPRSLLALARRVGLSPISYEEPSIHGGSMLVGFQASTLTGATFNKSPLYEESAYAAFAKQVQQTIGMVKGSGMPGPLVGYGAAAKGMTFLNATGLKLERIVDDNPLKHGRLTPGGNVLIGPVEDLPKGGGAIVVLAWNFWDEILGRIRQNHGSGHTVMRWLPKFELVMS